MALKDKKENPTAAITKKEFYISKGSVAFSFVDDDPFGCF